MRGGYRETAVESEMPDMEFWLAHVETAKKFIRSYVVPPELFAYLHTHEQPPKCHPIPF